jgi:hypothetical protein
MMATANTQRFQSVCTFIADFDQKRPISYGIAVTKERKKEREKFRVIHGVKQWYSTPPALAIHRNDDDGVANFSSRNNRSG